MVNNASAPPLNNSKFNKVEVLSSTEPIGTSPIYICRVKPVSKFKLKSVLGLDNNI